MIPIQRSSPINSNVHEVTISSEGKICIHTETQTKTFQIKTLTLEGKKLIVNGKLQKELGQLNALQIYELTKIINKLLETKKQEVFSASSFLINKETIKITPKHLGKTQQESPPATIAQSLTRIEKVFQQTKGAIHINEEYILYQGLKKETNKDNGPKTLSYTYKTPTATLGTQTIERVSTIDETITFTQKMAEYYLKKCQQEPNESLADHLKNYEYYDRQFRLALDYKENSQKDWCTSNYVRDTLKEKGFKEGVHHLISAPINMRVQQLEVHHPDQQEKNVAAKIVRTGVISDMSNGFVSLRELREMEKDSQNVIANVQKRLEKKSGKTEQQEALEHCKNQIRSNQLSATLEERRRFLEQQMFQLLSVQIKEHPELIQENAPFKLSHVSLLNQKTARLDGCGWMHNEQVEMDDMAEIFKDFDGATIRFYDDQNHSPPIIKEDGKLIISLPKPEGVNPLPQEITLNTYFFNLSVQGNVKNEGLQKEINQTTASKIHASTEFFGSCLLNVSNAEKTSYEMAEELVFQLNKNGFAVGMGCLSAKDRTGYVGEEVMQKALKEAHPDKKNFIDVYYGRLAFSLFGPASQVVTENTGERFLKTNPFYAKSLLHGVVSLSMFLPKNIFSELSSLPFKAIHKIALTNIQHIKDSFGLILLLKIPAIILAACAIPISYVAGAALGLASFPVIWGFGAPILLVKWIFVDTPRFIYQKIFPPNASDMPEQSLRSLYSMESSSEASEASKMINPSNKSLPKKNFC